MKTNRFLQFNEPWAVAKAVRAGDLDWATAAQFRTKIDCIVYYCAEATRIVGILLQPYMPAKAAQLLDMLGVDKSKRSFEDAKRGADYEYGVPKASVGRDAWDGLFPPLPVDT